MHDPDCLPVAQAWYLRTWRDFRMDVPQRHVRREIMYVLSGTCQMGAGDRKAAGAECGMERHAMRKGDFLYVDADVPHTLVTDPNGDCRMLNVEYVLAPQSGLHPGLAAQAAAVPELADFERSAPPRLFLKDTQDVGALLRSLVLELDGGAESTGWLVQSLFSALHIRLARLWAENARYREDAGERYVVEASRLLREHYGQPVRIADIAAGVNVHPAYLQRLFRSSRGMTMVDYLNRYRMEQAKMLLMTTDLPIADLCGYVGMNNRQHFTDVFRRVVGVAPGMYRRNASPTRFAHAEE